MRRIFPVLAIGAALSLTACSASTPEVVEYHADYPYYSSVDELCNAAEVVAVVSPIRSEVREVDVAAPPGDNEVTNPGLGVDDTTAQKPEPVLVVETITTVRIEAVFKGDVSVGSELEVGQPGGELDGVTYAAEAFDFGKAQPSLVFLDVWPNDVPASPLNPTQAAYRLADNGALISDGLVAGLDGVTVTSADSKLCR